MAINKNMAAMRITKVTMTVQEQLTDTTEGITQGIMLIPIADIMRQGLITHAIEDIITVHRHHGPAL
jgi:hypothetical protein